MTKLFKPRTLVLGGLAAAAVLGAMKNRHRVAGLIGARSSEPEPYPAPSSAPVGTPAVVHDEPAPPPEVSNYDAAGPVANTATHVPAPEPIVHEGGIDEDAEEAAAAAEAANIGGPAPEYAGLALDEPADEALRPLEEAGEGESEGLEQAEADLVDNAEPAAGDTIEAERQIDEVIEEQDDPFAGETVEPVVTSDAPHADAGSTSAPEAAAVPEPPAAEPEPEPVSAPLAPETLEDGAPTTGGTTSGVTETPAAEKSVWTQQPLTEQPTVESPEAKPAGDAPSAEDEDDGGSEWQTWSGRAVDR